MVTQSPEITVLILEWYKRIQAGEMVAAAEQILSREKGFLAIGTNVTEWFGDAAEVIRAYGETAKLGLPEIDVQRIEAYQEGSVGWAVDMVKLRRPGKGKTLMRHTFILHQEGSEWKVIHAHYSFPIPEDTITPTGA